MVPIPDGLTHFTNDRRKSARLVKMLCVSYRIVSYRYLAALIREERPGRAGTRVACAKSFSRTNRPETKPGNIVKSSTKQKRSCRLVRQNKNYAKTKVVQTQA